MLLMDTPTQLEAYADELAAAARCLADYYRGGGTAAAARPQVTVPPDAATKVHQARRTVLRQTTKLQALLAEPVDFLQHLAVQGQLVACLQWLGDFQVLACIPQSGSVSIKDVAQLCAVPEEQLSRVVRMAATAGFLHEPQTGHVAHTSSSAVFVSKPSLSDAAMFLAERAAPAALQMAPATRRGGGEKAQTLEPRSPRLVRQWAAYMQHIAAGMGGESIDVLRRLDWANLGSACVVDVGAPSAHCAIALAHVHRNLRFVVQISSPAKPAHHPHHPLQARTNGDNTPYHLADPGPGLSASASDSASAARVTLQTRVLGAPQTVHDAAVYILRLATTRAAVSSRSSSLGAVPSSTSSSSSSSSAQIVAELRAHLGVLAASNRATLIVMPPALLPEPGSVDPDIEARARMRDLSLFQLTNERELEISELSDLVSSVGDSAGRLVVVNQLRARNNVPVALGVRYRPYTVTKSAFDLQATLLDDPHILCREASTGVVGRQQVFGAW